jgi:hypothetical protein
MYSIEAIATVATRYLVARGTEGDAETVRLFCDKRYWNADSKTRRSTVDQYMDIPRLFGTFTWANLPTRYLRGIVSNEGLARIADGKLRSFGGAEGVRIADAIRG